jgi:hypothetical protein
VRWSDVISISKEKTALVIPNAIQIGTDKEKYFFTSFAARDKTYLMLYKLWQSSNMQQVSCLSSKHTYVSLTI